ncbi:MAG: hypothetical protein UU17_C0007G0014 [Candidatus Nomurabacteria bacterium GW2011_GWA1_40_8]|nr:MAG: hypothetical protein UU17_C0007G0014 [Candidatus Nomurabacteria bacterium GW2011_GWA1_40_8]
MAKKKSIKKEEVKVAPKMKGRVTEKASFAQEQNVYTFNVEKGENKILLLRGNLLQEVEAERLLYI